MEFIWPNWTIGSVLFYAFCILCSLGFGYGFAENRPSLIKVSGNDWDNTLKRERQRGFWWVAVPFTVLIFSTGYALLGVITYYVFTSGEPIHAASSRQVVEAFGLAEKTKYPLILGSRLGGTEVSANASGGFFYARASVSTGPASALSVGFSRGDKSYVLELPVSQITFVQSTSEDPSIEVYLFNKYTNVVLDEAYGPCKLVINGLFVNCRRPLLSSTVVLTENMDRRGLPPLLSTYLDSATITLTPQMYDRVLGLNSG